MMEDDSRLSMIAELISDHIALEGIDKYLAETGVHSSDFLPIEPREFEGDIFAVDGSNASICGWSTARVNLIRAGYAVYRGAAWRRTVITFDDVFLADPRQCSNLFDPYLQEFFDLRGVSFKESDLERLSSYYRELQEYVAINDALAGARPGDIILYDGSFEVFELLRGVLATIFSRAEEKGVALLAVAKSSSLFWGEEISLPFVQHTAVAGSQLLPGAAWHLSL
ncbi:MAG TPA: DNA double-strand break repair nuclease NurA, partial [Methanothrix soehngenii]|nr:DNA double-strand break repair nuclease NurA [Methanothrix soehngenii]